ncbi:UDP-glucose/GDP-mannose dehydrogenase family protein [Amycolatopsis sp.]|uniref:UDP-glucose dehydrogenase family protein n=1 Tax=Amycolatopsis sp. TaxID=37632 RepID=UPI002E05A2EC|nr:UDP-glucose/GDP-mannose dehydrogenase family protein [Amycolatopsis sp.]
MGRRVGVVGAGYVGLTSAACLAHRGHNVVCVEKDKSKVDRLTEGTVSIAEPRLPELVSEGMANGRLTFTSDPNRLAVADIVLLCLPTPMGPGGAADLGAVDSILPMLAEVLPVGCVLVTKSTVPVGTARRIAELLGRPDVPVVSNPEFLREGFAVQDFLHPDRIVVGAAEPPAATAVIGLYLGMDAPVLRTDTASAEMAKYASNAFLALKLSYVNVLAELCEQVGADMSDVGRTMGLDARIGPAFLMPGPGWGGSCLPKDTNALLNAADSAGVDFGLLRAAVLANTRQRDTVVRKIRTAATGSPAGSIRDMRIGLLGLTFKAGTDDLRDSPALVVAAELVAQGAILTAYDPCVPLAGQEGLPSVHLVDDPYLVAKDAAAIVVLTEWPEFRALDWAQLAAVSDRAVVIDTRNLLDGEVLAGTGFVHTGVGKPGVTRS